MSFNLNLYHQLITRKLLYQKYIISDIHMSYLHFLAKYFINMISFLLLNYEY